MFRSPRCRPKVLLKCKHPFKRGLSFLSTANDLPAPTEYRLPLASHSSPDAQFNDRVLRDVFDSQSFWRQFSKDKSLEPANRGLFCNRYLTRPDGFQTFADQSIGKANKIVAKVLSATSDTEYKLIVRDLDRLSDLICRVIDLADFVRGTHPDSAIQDAAAKAYGQMLNYMNVLNTTSGLNNQLQYAATTPRISASWTEEERKVADVLLRDFSKSAVDMDQTMKQRFIDHSENVSRWGTLLVDNMDAEHSHIWIQSKRLQGLDPSLIRKHQRLGRMKVMSIGAMSSMILRSAQSEAVRQEVYLASHRAAPEQIKRLENMLRARSELARLAGFTSFAHMILDEKMAGSPEAVSAFLKALQKDNSHKVTSELNQMRRLKDRHPRGQMSSELQIWDKSYFRRQILLSKQSESPPSRSAPLNSFFSVGTVIQGLSRLFHRLYGLRLIPRESKPGETWHPEVRRLDVIDENDGRVAVLYCDLFERRGKTPNPAHFTIRCSRRIAEDELVEEYDESVFASREEAANDGMAVTRNFKAELYQLPTIVLVCDFQRGEGQEPALLSFREVRILFHEMGHAVHSILGRTALHNVSGTRCATDFSELPSVIMESFAADPSVLGLFARHWQTDTPLPYEMVQKRIQLDESSEGCDTESQILMAMLDQALHTARADSKGFDSTAIYQAVYRANSSLMEPPGTSWQAFFGHLFGYGATYYAYLFDRAIAGKIWREIFQSGPHQSVSREAGELFKSEVLRHGGARDPWKCVAGVLNRPSLAEGGHSAVAEVGSWGVLSKGPAAL